MRGLHRSVLESLLVRSSGTSLRIENINQSFKFINFDSLLQVRGCFYNPHKLSPEPTISDTRAPGRRGVSRRTKYLSLVGITRCGDSTGGNYATNYLSFVRRNDSGYSCAHDGTARNRSIARKSGGPAASNPSGCVHYREKRSLGHVSGTHQRRRRVLFHECARSRLIPGRSPVAR